jgi:uncharacterized YigZ family protein
MQDFYRTVEEYLILETPKVKGSRFIAEVLPAESPEEAEAKLAVIRKREYNATHHCWAWRIGADLGTKPQMRYSDDGEPSGTAGAPMFRHIEGRDLTNILVVVTRYYGGTKLGTGGLIRAYGDAAAMALDACEVVEKIHRVQARLTFAYNDTSAAMHCIQKFDAPITATEYGNDTTLVLAVRASQITALQETFVEALGGRGKMG